MHQSLSVICLHLSRHLGEIKELRQINQLKIFLFRLLNEGKSQKSLGGVIYSLCQLLGEIKLCEKEVLKYRLVEILIKEIKMDNLKTIVFGSLKILKFLWRNNIRRSAILKQEIVGRLFEVYSMQSQIVFCFVEEIFLSERQQIFKEQPQFCDILIEMFKREKQEKANIILS